MCANVQMCLYTDIMPLWLTWQRKRSVAIEANRDLITHTCIQAVILYMKVCINLFPFHFTKVDLPLAVCNGKIVALFIIYSAGNTGKSRKW